VYDSEVQLKKLYIQTCKRLPAHGCKVYQVKELLRGKTKKKVSKPFVIPPFENRFVDHAFIIL
jgi:hypothetical protein